MVGLPPFRGQVAKGHAICSCGTRSPQGQSLDFCRVLW
jgi:hypothetical protein